MAILRLFAAFFLQSDSSNLSCCSFTMTWGGGQGGGQGEEQQEYTYRLLLQFAKKYSAIFLAINCRAIAIIMMVH